MLYFPLSIMHQDLLTFDTDRATTEVLCKVKLHFDPESCFGVSLLYTVCPFSKSSNLSKGVTCAWERLLGVEEKGDRKVWGGGGRGSSRKTGRRMLFSK
jgi:hypothetical protein